MDILRRYLTSYPAWAGWCDQSFLHVRSQGPSREAVAFHMALVVRPIILDISYPCCRCPAGNGITGTHVREWSGTFTFIFILTSHSYICSDLHIDVNCNHVMNSEDIQKQHLQILWHQWTGTLRLHSACVMKYFSLFVATNSGASVVRASNHPTIHIPQGVTPGTCKSPECFVGRVPSNAHNDAKAIANVHAHTLVHFQSEKKRSF